MSLIVLISGRGSNLRALLGSPVGAMISAVISDNKQAAGLDIATRYNKPTIICNRQDYPTKAAFEADLMQRIDTYQPTIIALGGFMSILSGDFVNRYHGRLVNIHPSLLPDFPGLDTHRRVLEAGRKKHGCSVHWVSEVIDGGEVIAQEIVPVLADDTVDMLATRVLAAEHTLYPRALAQLLEQ